MKVFKACKLFPGWYANTFVVSLYTLEPLRASTFNSTSPWVWLNWAEAEVDVVPPVNVDQRLLSAYLWDESKRVNGLDVLILPNASLAIFKLPVKLVATLSTFFTRTAYLG